ncbi:ATP-binding protein [Brevundimonas vesicularis]|uniref:ATP-binding protein n=1 Tax=Brevundimonas vesicularis TaxID=41276 RepID=UPI0038D49BAC
MLMRQLRAVLGLGQDLNVPVSPAGAGRRNMLLLIQLRWLAVAGQVLTIGIVHWGMKIDLPLVWLMLAPAALIVINLVSAPLTRRRPGVPDVELLLALSVDVAALTWLLFFTGGSTNPFAPLYVMQIVLAAVLLKPAYAWGFVAVNSLLMGLLTVWHRPLQLPQAEVLTVNLLQSGMLVNFTLIAVLLVVFVTLTSKNLRARDAYLAEARQQAAEQDHIVRMGLLASGAAHELGTPLASLSVILSDWKRMPIVAGDSDLNSDLEVMQAEVERCKIIVTGILMSAGEARGQAPVVTSLQTFLHEVVEEWQGKAGAEVQVQLVPAPMDPPIIADAALKQVFSALLDNAQEAGARRVVLNLEIDDERLVIEFNDDGRGFPSQILERLGQPYQSTKGRAGAGLGLFLLVNVLRKMGGIVTAANRRDGGACVRLSLPMDALAPR